MANEPIVVSSRGLLGGILALLTLVTAVWVASAQYARQTTAIENLSNAVTALGGRIEVVLAAQHDLERRVQKLEP